MRTAGLRLIFSGLVVAAVIMSLGEISTRGVGEQFKPALDEAREDEGELVRHNCRAHGKRIEPLVCFYGRKEAEKRVVLFGDSHALQWGPALIPLAKRRGWRLITVLRAGCPIADVPTEKSCAKWRGRALSRIESLGPTHVIIATSIGSRYRLKHQGRNLSRRASEGELREGMVRTIKRLKRIGTLAGNSSRVTMIRDQIVAPFVPADCLRRNRGRIDRCDFPKRRKFGPGFDIIAAKRTGIGPAIDPSEVLCGREWCSPTRGRTLKYRDADHITATYARSLTGWLDQRLEIR